MVNHEHPVSVNTFYIDESCKNNFQEIAVLSKGKCQELKLEGEKGSEILTNFITETILSSIGKEFGNTDELVTRYREKFKKSYIK